MSDQAKRVIDSDVSEIRDLLKSGRYSKLVYSATDASGDDLGTGLFVVPRSVRAYIIA